ncbi:hypothetical protein HY504_00110 [Candidatus Wolfebacteria bacterium]|nr:hypothetical protein [Candidatus Wolfebacteria bacterium]
MDPHTGDELWSAQDIRISKGEGVAMEWERQISRIKKLAFRDLWPSSRLRELGELLRQEKWISEEEFRVGMIVLDKYEEWEKKEGKYRKEDVKEENRENLGEEIQGGIELEVCRKEAKWKSAMSKEGNREGNPFHYEKKSKRQGIYGHRRGMDSDPRGEWRRELGKMK